MDPTIIENIYPFSESEFYQSNMKKNVHFKKQENCLTQKQWKQSCEPSVSTGYHKPLKESCVQITGQLNNGPLEAGCTSIWNNMTKRKSLVKDY